MRVTPNTLTAKTRFSDRCSVSTLFSGFRFISFHFRSFVMKFSIVRLEERIAPSRGPVQQAIVVGGGKGSKGGAGLAMAQQSLGGSGSPWQQAIVVGGGKGSKGGAGLIMAQQGLGGGCGCW
jgi:hypothetical protein